MKQSVKITLCAISAALSAVVIMLGYFPYFTYAAPAVAGLFVMLPMIEIGIPYAIATYLTGSVLVFLFAEPETKILYLMFFGFYPILKAVFEKTAKRVLEWLFKILSFSASVFLMYLVFRYLTDIDVTDFGPFGKYGAVIFLVLCYVAFVLYDIAISRVSVFYFVRIRPNLKGIKK